MSEADTLCLNGHYVNGNNHAHECFKWGDRINLLNHNFGCTMFGTFNVRIDQTQLALLQKFKPTKIVVEEDKKVTWWFYLCDVVKDDVVKPAWILRWRSPKKTSESVNIELMSRELLPEYLKTYNLDVRVYAPWTKEVIDRWVPNQYWFQTFPWSPPKADSKFVWDSCKQWWGWNYCKVLDIGGHTGFFSFEAAKSGAFVSLFEPDVGVLDRARTIGRHIECQDIEYFDRDPGGKFDVILYLSVHHQPDPTYSELEAKIKELKSRCKVLFLELIVPPLSGSMSAKDVDELVGGSCLVTYKHKVRRNRSIYQVRGDIDWIPEEKMFKR